MSDTKTQHLPVTTAPPPAQPRSYTGLCRDCVKSPTCTFPRDPRRPVWACDEYESPPNGFPGPRRDLPAYEDPAPAGGEPAGEPKGLCRTCLNASTCTFPKPPGGVWQCEELA